MQNTIETLGNYLKGNVPYLKFAEDYAKTEFVDGAIVASRVITAIDIAWIEAKKESEGKLLSTLNEHSKLAFELRDNLVGNVLLKCKSSFRLYNAFEAKTEDEAKDEDVVLDEVQKLLLKLGDVEPFLNGDANNGLDFICQKNRGGKWYLQCCELAEMLDNYCDEWYKNPPIKATVVSGGSNSKDGLNGLLETAKKWQKITDHTHELKETRNPNQSLFETEKEVEFLNELIDWFETKGISCNPSNENLTQAESKSVNLTGNEKSVLTSTQTAMLIEELKLEGVIVGSNVAIFKQFEELTGHSRKNLKKNHGDTYRDKGGLNIKRFSGKTKADKNGNINAIKSICVRIISRLDEDLKNN